MHEVNLLSSSFIFLSLILCFLKLIALITTPTGDRKAELFAAFR